MAANLAQFQRRRSCWLAGFPGRQMGAHRDEGIGYSKFRQATLLPISGGSPQKIVGLAADDDALGWTSDGQLYVEKAGDAANVMLHIEKLNPRTGARTVWRDLMTPSIGGVIPEPPLITADGETYLYNYRMRLYDLYTVSGVR